MEVSGKKKEFGQGLVDWLEEEDSGCQSGKVVQIFRSGGAEHDEDESGRVIQWPERFKATTDCHQTAQGISG
jgi:hypothetical protein